MKNFIKTFLIITIIFGFESVSAATVSEFWCDKDTSILYEVSYDNLYVNKNNLSKENIVLGYVKGHENDNNYKIERYSTTKSCSVSGDGTVTSCPSNASVSPFLSSGIYSMNNMLSEKFIIIDYNLGTGRFDIKIKEDFAKKYYIRRVPTYKNSKGVYEIKKDDDIYSRNTTGRRKSFYPNDQFLGSSLTFHAAPNEGVLLEFYEKNDSKCQEVILADQHYVMSDLSTIEIDNPAVKDSKSSAYQKCSINIRDNPDYANDSTSIQIKKSVVPICYDEKTTVNEYNNLTKTIEEAIPILNKLLIGVVNLPEEKLDDPLINAEKSCSSGKGKYKCDDSLAPISTPAYTVHYNPNFTVQCRDTYSFGGAEPKLTYAGGGFEYGKGINYSLIRSCEITWHNNPAVKLPKCTGSVCVAVTSFDGNLSGDEFIVEGSNAGPNDEFDSCISECDNGAYSQACINSCYNKVYGDDTKRSDALDKMSNTYNLKKEASKLLNINDKKPTVLKVGDVNNVPIFLPPGFSTNPTGPDETPSGREGEGYDVINSCGDVVGHGVVSSSYCSTYGNYTSWNCYNVPVGCVCDPDSIYNPQVAAIRGNLTAAQTAMFNALSLGVGKVNLSIVDSYLKNANGKFYVFNINNYDSDVRLILDYDNDSLKGKIPGTTSGSALIGIDPYGPDERTASWSNHSNGIAIKNVRISGTSYIGKTYGNVVYNNNNNNFTINKNDGGNYGINHFNTFNKSDYYDGNYYDGLDPKGYPKYYTSLFSDNKNVIIDEDGKAKLNRECYNIELTVAELGNSYRSYNFSNSCYYGVYNNYIKKEEKCTDPKVCETNEEVGEIRYIFRPIELTDVFPDREPRWNWTNAAILKPDKNGNDPYLGYVVNPEDTTAHIEEIGHDILKDSYKQLDYEIIIGNKNIRMIKGYNKDNKNYTEFHLNCKGSGVTLCKSDFLDFGGYIGNQGFTRVKDISTKNGWEW